jgi:murein L,D-transpeptidase YcbB/YkuD
MHVGAPSAGRHRLNLSAARDIDCFDAPGPYESGVMSPFAWRMRAGAGWIGLVACAATFAVARADQAPREISRLDLAPEADGAPEALSRAPLPPEAPPPSEIAPKAAPVGLPADAAASPAPAADGVFDLSGPLTAYVAQTPAAHAIDDRAAREAIREFYTVRNDAPLWVDANGLTPRGRELLARLNRASEDGLDLPVLEPPGPGASENTPERLAAVEIQLSALAVSYALEATGVRAPPASISASVTAHPAVADPMQALSAIAAAPDPGEALLAFNPSQKGYRDLREQLGRLRDRAPVATLRPALGPVLRIGMSDPRVPLIRARFGLGAQPPATDARIYDVRVASAVAAFQRVHGLAADGALNAATSEALFGDPNARRETLIIANMEMWRWEPREMGQRRVEINVPDFTLRVLDGDDELRRARVIVGKPDTPTPIFSNEIKYILLNPVWRVPDSIVKKEMAPKLADDPDYLTRRGFKVTRVGDRLEVEQPPGEANALGRILFMFPNEHAVYLHDTPTRGLFATARRAYSHGCIRVEDPARLAELAMGGAARGWTAARFESMVGTAEKTIFLPRSLPIHIEYFTEFVDANGQLRELEDLYGLTGRVAATLSRLRQD